MQTVDRFKSTQPVDGLHQQEWLFSELIVLSQLQEPAKSPLQVVSLVSRPACIAKPERFIQLKATGRTPLFCCVCLPL